LNIDYYYPKILEASHVCQIHTDTFHLSTT